MEKKCTKCGKSYPLTAEFFHRSKNSKTGFSSQCKPCTLLKKKEYREKNREKIRNMDENISRINYIYLAYSCIKNIILRASRGILERKNFGRLNKI